MLHVVATVCLLYSSPHLCKDLSLTFALEGTPHPAFACQTPAVQSYLANWVESHPRWYVKRWACRGRLEQSV